MNRNRLVHVSLACSFALVTACGDRDTAATTDTLAARADSMGTMSPGMSGTTTGTAAGTLADPSTAAQIDSVATAASGGLTAIPASLAVSLIRSLEQKLDATEDPALDDIADELEKLREELDGDINGGDVASILERLGPKVQAVAPRAGAAQGQLTAIANALTAAVPTLRAKK